MSFEQLRLDLGTAPLIFPGGRGAERVAVIALPADAHMAVFWLTLFDERRPRHFERDFRRL